MKLRRFGRTGWQVSEIGYGMWGMAGWTGSEDAESLAALQRSIDLGCNFFDTAWAYGDGHSEKLLGEPPRANSEKKIYVATKVPPKNRCWPSKREFSLDDSYPPEYVFEYVDKSLKNLDREALDLIQYHTWEDGWLDDPRTQWTIEMLRSSGKVRAVGISQNRWEPENGVRAVRSGLIDAVQIIYNIFDQNPEDTLFPACAKSTTSKRIFPPVTRGRCHPRFINNCAPIVGIANPPRGASNHELSPFRPHRMASQRRRVWHVGHGCLDRFRRRRIARCPP